MLLRIASPLLVLAVLIAFIEIPSVLSAGNFLMLPDHKLRAVRDISLRSIYARPLNSTSTESIPAHSSNNGKFTSPEVLGVIGLFCFCGVLGGCRIAFEEEEASFVEVPEYRSEDDDDPEVHQRETDPEQIELVEGSAESPERAINLTKTLSKSFSFSLSRSRSMDVNGERYDALPVSPQGSDHDPSSLSSSSSPLHQQSPNRRLIISRSISTSEDPFDRRTGRSRVVRFMDDPKRYAAIPLSLSTSPQNRNRSRDESPVIDAFEITAITIDEND